MESGKTCPSEILVVDDVAANLDLLCGILREQGHKVRAVPGGEQALTAATLLPPDLILLDIDMPGMDGFEVCRKLKDDPALRGIPVIFVTAMTDVRDKVRGFSLGAVDYITKPFQFEEVTARVSLHLELVRQRRRLQESLDRQRELELLRDSLVHMLVHDLRAPLTLLSMSLELFGDDPAASPATGNHDELEIASNAVKRMILMVNSVLDVHQLEADKMQVRIARCDPAALVREVLDSVRPMAGDRSLTLQEGPGALLADMDRELIFRTLSNLVVNALKFTPETGGRIIVDVARVEGGVRLSVTDNGPGIPAEHHARIFEKFGQVANASSRKFFSTGLGLPFCRLAVQAHGGSIGVQSGTGRGSTFWFILPDHP